MIELRIAWEETVLWVMVITLGLLLLTIAYKKLIAKFSEGNPNTDDYCVLHSLESSPATGEIEIYFTMQKGMRVEIQLLNAELELMETIVAGDFTPGGNIVRFDTGSIQDGEYYYCLRTANQKTMKKMSVKND